MNDSIERIDRRALLQLARIRLPLSPLWYFPTPSPYSLAHLTVGQYRFHLDSGERAEARISVVHNILRGMYGIYADFRKTPYEPVCSAFEVCPSEEQVKTIETAFKSFVIRREHGQYLQEASDLLGLTWINSKSLHSFLENAFVEQLLPSRRSP